MRWRAAERGKAVVRRRVGTRRSQGADKLSRQRLLSIGTVVRAWLGRFESPAAEAYRSLFVDLAAFGDVLVTGVPTPRRVLEIGCGDGATADTLHRAFPSADYLGIDVAPEPGRRFNGDPRRASFASITSTRLRASGPEVFDLIVVVDVLHHIPGDPERCALLADAAAMAAPAATIVVKEWVSDGGSMHWLAWLADRYISGDRTVRFGTTRSFAELLGGALPKWSLAWSSRVPPWPNNVLVALQRTPERSLQPTARRASHDAAVPR